MKRLWKRIATALLALLVLSACGGPGGGGPPPPNEDEVVVPETTKVIDQATRDSLLEFTDTGTLRFADVTPQLASLEPGDVVVGEPSAAAPFGFLRKVTAIHQEDEGLRVETEFAALDEAVDRGKLIIEKPLTADDLVSTEVHLEGVSITSESGLSTLQGDEDKYAFTLTFNKVLYDLDGDEDSKGDQVVLTGTFQFDPTVTVKANYDFDLLDEDKKEFEAVLGFRQKAELSFDAIAALKLKKEIKVADFDFGTYTFFIGPVPVIVTPKIEVVIGVEGDLRAQTKISVEQTSSVQIGAKYTNSDGWDNLSGATLDFDFNEPEIDGIGTKAKAFVGPKAIVLFYGVAGVGAFSKLFTELDLKLGRDPHWLLKAGITAEFGVEVDIPIIGEIAELKLTVIDEEFVLTQSENAPPTLEIIEPEGGTDLTLNRQVFLIAEVQDLEDGAPSVAWSSDVDGALGDDAVEAPTFTTAGQRIITVVATDSNGLSLSRTVTVDVVNTPPTPFVAGPGVAVPATTQTLFLGGASDPNDPNEFGAAFGVGVVTCDRVTWSVSAPDTVTAESGCQVGVIFNEPGLRTVTLTAIDTHGATTSLDALVSVGPAPANPAPVIEAMSVTNNSGEELTPGDFICSNCTTLLPLTLSVSASEPDGEALSFSWLASFDGGPFLEIGTTATLVWDPNDTFDVSRERPLVIRVRVSDGTTEIHSPELTFSLAFVEP